MGKNPNEEKTDAADSYASRSYPPYQNGETYARPPVDAASSTKALTESETIAREIKEGTLSGFVGSGTAITGESSFKSMLRIDGRYSGRITSPTGTLIVGSGGQVDANVEVAVATIHGVVNGDITATQRIELGRAGKLNGNIQTPSLMIEQGGIFEGSCKMVQQKAAAEKTAKVDRKDNLIDTGKLEAVKKTEDAHDIKPVIAVAASS
jgi:cytoskeletal protein CcmA (bactofilin family)